MAMLMPVDQSDAPLSYGIASHVQDMAVNSSTGIGLQNISELYLGTIPGDADTYDNRHSMLGAMSNGDDGDGINDEDGSRCQVPYWSGLAQGQISPYRPLTSHWSIIPLSPATLHAWVDFNQDNQFGTDEYTSIVVSPGASLPDADLVFSQPSDIVYGDTQIRLRLTSDTQIDAHHPDGIAFDGEVEDHKISLLDICTASAYSDYDGDGVNDVCDLDNDNDGILDSDEGLTCITSTTSNVMA